MSRSATISETSQDLVRFLLGCVDDDERDLKRLVRQRHDLDVQPAVRSVDRLLAELATKRRLIGCLQQLLVLRDQPLEKAVRDQASQMLRVLAAPYQDLPAYRPEWRPSGSH